MECWLDTKLRRRKGKEGAFCVKVLSLGGMYGSGFTSPQTWIPWPGCYIRTFPVLESTAVTKGLEFQDKGLYYLVTYWFTCTHIHTLVVTLQQGNCNPEKADIFWRFFTFSYMQIEHKTFHAAANFIWHKCQFSKRESMLHTSMIMMYCIFEVAQLSVVRLTNPAGLLHAGTSEAKRVSMQMKCRILAVRIVANQCLAMHGVGTGVMPGDDVKMKGRITMTNRKACTPLHWLQWCCWSNFCICTKNWYRSTQNLESCFSSTTAHLRRKLYYTGKDVWCTAKKIVWLLVLILEWYAWHFLNNQNHGIPQMLRCSAKSPWIKEIPR